MQTIFNDVVTVLTSLGIMPYFGSLVIVVLGVTIWELFTRKTTQTDNDDTD